MNKTNTPDCLKEATELYLLYLQDSGKSPRTLYTYGKDLDQIIAFFGPEKEIRQITLPLMGRFLKSPELNTLPNGNTRAAKTIQKTVRVFRQFMMWCYQEDLIESLTLPKCMTGRFIKTEQNQMD
jgi:site-specific recombinase XerD